MKSLTYIGKIDGSGKLTGPDSEHIRKDLQATFAGQFVRIEVTGWVTEISSAARGYYFAVMIPAVLRGLRDLGHRVDPANKTHRTRCHKMLKAMFLDSEVEGEEPSTKDRGDEAFRVYMEEVDQWAQEFLGITIEPAKKKEAR